MPIQTFDERQPLAAGVTIAAADTTVPKNLSPGLDAPYRIDDVLLTNPNAGAHIVSLWQVCPTGTFLLGSVNVPAGSGYAGTPPVFAAATLAPPALAGWCQGAGMWLKVAVTVTLSGGDTIDALAVGGNF